MSPLDLDGFLEVLREEFDDIDPALIQGNARLLDDAALDSLQLLRLMVVVESLAPIELPPQLDLTETTFGDVHYYYEVQASNLPDDARSL